LEDKNDLQKQENIIGREFGLKQWQSDLQGDAKNILTDVQKDKFSDKVSNRNRRKRFIN